ncbi:MAG: hypothetical protein AAFP16_18195 [Pseudomonadota bacterium]
MTVEHDSGGVSKEVLWNLSEHLKGLTEDVTRIEQAITSFRDADTAVEPQALVDLQRIDLVLQTLHDLATLTGLMANGSATADKVAQSLKLAATRALVSEAGNAADSEPGHLDLF